MIHSLYGGLDYNSSKYFLLQFNITEKFYLSKIIKQKNAIVLHIKYTSTLYVLYVFVYSMLYGKFYSIDSRRRITWKMMHMIDI